MAVVQTLIGNIKGPAGATGPTGATGAQGDAATIEVGTVSTSAYGTNAQVTNSGSSSEAVFDFVIPQGAPGETVTDMSALTLNTITPSSASFPTITAGDIGRVLFGKINKFFADIRTAINGKLDLGGTVATGTNIDNVTEPGVYYLYSGNSYTNLPGSYTYGTLFVVRGTTTTNLYSQIFVYPTTEAVVYIRNTTTGATGWRSWKRLASEADITPTDITMDEATGVTVTVKRGCRVGDLVWINAIFTIDSSFSSGTNLFTGLPGVPIVSGAGQTTYFSAIKATDNTAVTVYVNSGGQIKNNGSMPAGAYLVNACYRAAAS